MEIRGSDPKLLSVSTEYRTNDLARMDHTLMRNEFSSAFPDSVTV